MSRKEPLSKATIKTRRRRKPVFVDEPLQWHLRTTRYDRCPYCGLGTLEMHGASERRCTSCGLAWKITLTASNWFSAKMRTGSVEQAVVYEPFVEVLDKQDCHTLEDAQLRSATGRGGLLLLCMGSWKRERVVYWHRVGHLPEFMDGQRACEGGSKMHSLLLSIKDDVVWTPDESLNEMEVIARAYGTNNDIFYSMSK